MSQTKFTILLTSPQSKQVNKQNKKSKTRAPSLVSTLEQNNTRIHLCSKPKPGKPQLTNSFPHFSVHFPNVTHHQVKLILPLNISSSIYFYLHCCNSSPTNITSWPGILEKPVTGLFSFILAISSPFSSWQLGVLFNKLT